MPPASRWPAVACCITSGEAVSDPPPPRQRPRLRSADLHGLSRLGIEAVLRVTELVEAVHAGIQRTATLRSPAAGDRIGGIAGLAYGGVRGVTGVVGKLLEAITSRLPPGPEPGLPNGRREALLAALNGVLGDHLEASNNPLAISLRLLHGGRALTLDDPAAIAAAVPLPSSRLLLMLHGLCMHPGQWQAGARPHGEAAAADVASLAVELGYTPLHLHYNSGRAIAANGGDLAVALQALIAHWPVEVTELALVGHSMGGLLARSACLAGFAQGFDWTSRRLRVICLGSPHHGAPLERAGHGVDRLLSALPLLAPFARIGKLRSTGITDLRHGRLLGGSADRAGREPPPPLPPQVELYALAATRSPRIDRPPRRLRGDGLVPVASALGEHADPRRQLHIPAERQQLLAGVSHLELLQHPQVLHTLRMWLQG